MNARLSLVELEGDWAQWLLGLTGWRRGDTGQWIGCGAVLRDGRAPGTMCVEIDIENGSERKRINLGKGQIRLTNADQAALPAWNDRTFNLNHVAINVSPKNTTLVDWLKAAGTGIFLERERRYDPTVAAMVEAEHLVSSETLYLTTRFLPTCTVGSELSHVGWQVQDRGTVLRAAALLRKLDWQIVFGPDVVDGSFLVHFRGPDGRIHDVFHLMGP